jgi:hypothetical protein
MTIEQFDNTGFTGGMKVVYAEQEFDLVSVDFHRRGYTDINYCTVNENT